MNTLTAMLLLLIGLGGLAALHFRSYRRRCEARRAFMAPALRLLDSAEILQDASDFPRIAGRYRGRRVQVAYRPDLMPGRKQPALWLLVSMAAELPDRTLSLMRQPGGREHWSPFARLGHVLARPDAWPQDVHFRADSAATAMLLGRIEALRDIAGDRRCKEILVTRAGVRIAWHAGEGDPARMANPIPSAAPGRLLDISEVTTVLQHCIRLAAAMEGRQGERV